MSYCRYEACVKQDRGDGFCSDECAKYEKLKNSLLDEVPQLKSRIAVLECKLICFGKALSWARNYEPGTIDEIEAKVAELLQEALRNERGY